MQEDIFNNICDILVKLDEKDLLIFENVIKRIILQKRFDGDLDRFFEIISCRKYSYLTVQGFFDSLLRRYLNCDIKEICICAGSIEKCLNDMNVFYDSGLIYDELRKIFVDYTSRRCI